MERKSYKPLREKIIKIVKYVAIVFFVSSFLITLLYKRVNPPFTPLMVIRAIESENTQFSKKWVPIQQISKDMIYATMWWEDRRFLTHWGINKTAFITAIKENILEGKTAAGYSSITQQTAKNVFLWPSRSYIRKALEIYYTYMIERIWWKQRILEVYLNSIEFGSRIYGVEAAAKHYFNISASQLTLDQASFLVAILPNPRYYQFYPNEEKILKKRVSILDWVTSRIRSKWYVMKFIGEVYKVAKEEQK